MWFTVRKTCMNSSRLDHFCIINDHPPTSKSRKWLMGNKECLALSANVILVQFCLINHHYLQQHNYLYAHITCNTVPFFTTSRWRPGGGLPALYINETWMHMVLWKLHFSAMQIVSCNCMLLTNLVAYILSSHTLSQEHNDVQYCLRWALSRLIYLLVGINKIGNCLVIYCGKIELCMAGRRGGRREECIWGDIHRMFLQIMMSRRVISAQEMRKVYSKLEPDESMEC